MLKFSTEGIIWDEEAWISEEFIPVLVFSPTFYSAYKQILLIYRVQGRKCHKL